MGDVASRLFGLRDSLATCRTLLSAASGQPSFRCTRADTGLLARPRLVGYPRLGTLLSGTALVIRPVVLFFALYATFAELEEVVVLKAIDRNHQAANLRLWVVDRDGAAWVTMPYAKADEHGLSEVRVELLRNGETRCVQVSRIEDRETVNEIHRLRHEKYAVQRFATSIGLFGREAGENTVTLRLDPCMSG